jgi:hypothetical protein
MEFTSWNRLMPFYLVTQTTLIEAEDEERAAEKTLLRIRESGEVGFCVKYDDANTKQILVPSPASTSPEASVRQDVIEPQSHFAPVAESRIAARRPMGFALLMLLFLAGFGLGSAFVYML